MAAIGERERTLGRAVLGVIDGHGSLQKERFGIWGESRGSDPEQRAIEYISLISLLAYRVQESKRRKTASFTRQVAKLGT